jgi:dipeptidase E
VIESSANANRQASKTPAARDAPLPGTALSGKEGAMKLLLTSGGVSNQSIRDALADLLGKPIAESTALCIPTAMYGMLPGTAVMTWRQIAGQTPTPLVELGWRSVGMLELTALPSIDEENWVPMVRETDALLVCGGDVLYLNHSMRASGLADLFPSLSDTVYVGLSAGSMVMAPRVGEEFVGWKPASGGDSALGMVGFSIFPHLDNADCPENSMAHAEKWAAHAGTGLRGRRPDRHQGGGRCRRGRLRGALEALRPLGRFLTHQWPDQSRIRPLMRGREASAGRTAGWWAARRSARPRCRTRSVAGRRCR